MPINYAEYPPHWPDLRKQCLDRDGHKCTFCGVPEYALRRSGDRRHLHLIGPFESHTAAKAHKKINGLPHTIIVLSIAHLDRDKDNWEVTLDRLVSACQACHLAYDMDHHVLNRKESDKRKLGHHLTEKLF